jgi:hypothetical protein
VVCPPFRVTDAPEDAAEVAEPVVIHANNPISSIAPSATSALLLLDVGATGMPAETGATLAIVRLAVTIAAAKSFGTLI